MKLRPQSGGQNAKNYLTRALIDTGNPSPARSIVTSFEAIR
jgi:hypothetical protein